MSSQKFITAEMFRNAFVTEWQSRVTQSAEELDRIYADSRSWTHLMKGESGILISMMESLKKDTDTNLIFKNEWYTVDVLYIETTDSEIDSSTFPLQIHALIEHENRDDVEVEMWKLIFWRAPLKVIFFYDWNESDKYHRKSGRSLEDRANWLHNKIQFLSRMRDLANEFHGENEATEYLFIIGSKDDNEKIRWRWASPDQQVPMSLC